MDTPNSLPVVTARDIDAVPDPTPQFKGWVWNYFFRGELDLIIAAVLKQESATTIQGALTYLNEVSRDQVGAFNVAVVDMSRRGKAHYRMGELREKLLGQPKRPAERNLLQGQIGHKAAVALLMGDCPLLPVEEVQAPKQKSDQFDLLQDVAAVAREQLRAAIQKQTGDANLRAAYRRLGSAVVTLKPICRNTESQTWSRTTRSCIARLYAALRTIYGEFFDELLQKASVLNEHIMLLTCMSWAQLALKKRELRRERILFAEVIVIPSYHRFSGGRIDALEVCSIGGQPPNETQQATLHRLASKKWSSVRQLIMELRRVFGGRSLQLKIIDFKFLVGDIIQWRSSTIPEMQLPMEDHQQQMERYLTLIPFIYNHGKKKRLRNGARWTTNDFSLKAEIWYILADRRPVIYPLKLNGLERERQFVENVVANWRAVRRRASLRLTSNHLVGHALNLLGSKAPRPIKAVAIQPSLFDAGNFGGTILGFIESQPQPGVFLDDHHVLEIVGRKGGINQLELHLDTYIGAVEHGLFSAPNLRTDGDCKIVCPMPEHKERTGSCHLYLTASPPRFHCFSCGGRGKIALSSLPRESIQALSAAWSNPEGRAWPLPGETVLQIPPEHALIMMQVQACLQVSARMTKHQPGYQYLWKERGLDLDSCHRSGLGYWDTQWVIPALLDEGYSFEQLVHYGFLAFGEKIRSNSELVMLLRQRGLELKDLRRPMKQKTNGSVVWDLPYPTLDRRITAPLTLLGQPNNFYGRDTRSGNKRYTHRKLTTKHTGIPQGGFNLEVLSDPNAKEVIVTEAVIDCLTLMEMGYKHVMAMIGVGNRWIISEAALAQKRVALALDNDDSGRRETTKLMHNLQLAGLTQRVRNLTPELQVRFPGGHKDPNGWWQKFIKTRNQDEELRDWSFMQIEDND